MAGNHVAGKLSLDAESKSALEYIHTVSLYLTFGGADQCRVTNRELRSEEQRGGKVRHDLCKLLSDTYIQTHIPSLEAYVSKCFLRSIPHTPLDVCASKNKKKYTNP